MNSRQTQFYYIHDYKTLVCGSEPGGGKRWCELSAQGSPQPPGTLPDGIEPCPGQRLLTSVVSGDL